MQNLYLEVNSLDQRAVERYALSSKQMMEHAASAIARVIHAKFPPDSHVLIVCGKGNNGEDGRVLARILEGDYHIFLTPEPSKRYDVIVDALFGSGLSRALDQTSRDLLDTLNALEGYKIACDLPSGLFPDGSADPHTFKADLTVTMGALKRSLFSDTAKELVGEIIVADLGISRSRYEIPSQWKLLDRSDVILPMRTQPSAHKGSYGHLGVICGEKTGASIIAASAALRFGTGLVSLISNENVTIPYELMQNHSLPSTATAIALGMGLGTEFGDDELSSLTSHRLPMVLDADIFYHPMFLSLLAHPSLVLTPHPKEFVQILRVCGIADIDVTTLQNNRFNYVEAFCSAYPDTVLVLKGSNVIIARKDEYYINPHGTVALAKGGSGDVLSGMIGALLAQGYEPMHAAIHASLAHTLSAHAFEKNNYALTPSDLIEGISRL